MNRFAYIAALIAIALIERLLIGFIHPGQNVEANLVFTVVAALIAITWISVLRAQNAGKPSWIGAVVLIPFVGTVLFIYLLFVPPRQNEPMPAT